MSVEMIQVVPGLSQETLVDRQATSDQNATMTKKRSKQPTLISDQLRAAVRDSGMSAYAICKLADVDKSSISRFLSGERQLSMEAADRVCEVLGLKLLSEDK